MVMLFAGRTKTLFLDTREYVIQFEDREEAALAANAIAQSMYAQCGPDGNHCVMFKALLYCVILTRECRRRTAVNPCDVQLPVVSYVSNGKMEAPVGRNCPNTKESHPIERAEYADDQDL